MLEKSRWRTALRPLECVSLQGSGTNVVAGTGKDVQDGEMESVEGEVKVEMRSGHALRIPYCCKLAKK